MAPDLIERESMTAMPPRAEDSHQLERVANEDLLVPEGLVIRRCSHS